MIDAASLAGLSALGASVWLWRAAKIAALFKILSVASMLIVGMNLLGVIEIAVHPGAAIEILSQIRRVIEQVLAA